MNYLVVVAHPDDEILGAGATIYKLTKEGNSVDVCILSSEANARFNRPSTDALQEDMNNSSHVVGIQHVYQSTFPNIEFNTVPHLQLVQFIESIIVKTNAEVIFTHHPSDLNNDHLHTSLACQAAARLFQRKPNIVPLKELLFMEVPSATEWSLNKGINQFNPNTFIEVGKEAIDKKIEALSLYQGVMRNFPHPRSKEVLAGLAAFRGGQGGMMYAEAFESVYRRGL